MLVLNPAVVDTDRCLDFCGLGRERNIAIAGGIEPLPVLLLPLEPEVIEFPIVDDPCDGTCEDHDDTCRIRETHSVMSSDVSVGFRLTRFPFPDK